MPSLKTILSSWPLANFKAALLAADVVYDPVARRKGELVNLLLDNVHAVSKDTRLRAEPPIYLDGEAPADLGVEEAVPHNVPLDIDNIIHRSTAGVMQQLAPPWRN